MKYWINIHHPRAYNASKHSQHRIYLQKKNEKYIGKIKYGDIAFIYETAYLSGETVVREENGKRKNIHLGTGKKGIIAIVKINKTRQWHKWLWNGVPYIRYIETKELNLKKPVLKLEEINRARRKNGIKAPFSPRINGGFRELSEKEAKIMANEMGVKLD